MTFVMVITEIKQFNSIRNSCRCDHKTLNKYFEMHQENYQRVSINLTDVIPHDMMCNPFFVQKHTIQFSKQKTISSLKTIMMSTFQGHLTGILVTFHCPLSQILIK